jgi:large subunit ribosomal protein L5
MSTVQGDNRLEDEGQPPASAAPEQPPADEGQPPASAAPEQPPAGEGQPPAGEGQPPASAAPEQPPAGEGQPPAGEGQPPASAAPEQPPARARTSRRKEGSGGKRKARGATQVIEGAPSPSDGVPSDQLAPPPRPRLLDLYRSEVVPTMVREFQYRNVMEVPRLTKVTLNIGLGEALTNPNAVESATRDLVTISGQKPIVTRARKSIAGFKLREGNPIGLCVTLRGSRMYYFMDRLLNAALPRIRDFRGLPLRSFDGRGNYSLGIREQIVFPEVDYAQIDRIRGLQVTITTNARNDGEAARLLALLGMPFARQN